MTLTPEARARGLRAAADWCEALADDPNGSPGGWYGQGGSTVDYLSSHDFAMRGGCALGYAAWAACDYPSSAREIANVFGNLSTGALDRCLFGHPEESVADWYMDDVVKAFDGSGIGRERDSYNPRSLRACAVALRAHADRISPAESAIPVIESKELVCLP